MAYYPKEISKSNVRFGKFANDRIALNRKLYLTCRELAGSEKNDTEAVKTIRDNYIIGKFGKSYKELSLIELRTAINDLQPNRVQYATKEQIKLFNYYAVSVALIYHNFDKLQYTNISTGEVLESEKLREYCFDLFKRDISIPKQVLRELFDNYINPKSNAFLMEGDFKKYIKSKNILYYDRLTREQIQYIITRYSKIFSQLTKYDIPKIHNN